MKRIPLTQGKYAIVDDEDFEWLNRWRWKYHKDGYAVRTATGNRNVYMHREVNKTPKGLLTDHINRNGLDNRRCNLRTTDYRGNALNTGLPSNNTSGRKGVTWNKNRNRWQAQINSKKETVYLGLFENIKDAINARKRAEYEQAL